MVFYGGLLAVATLLLAISFVFGHDHDFDHSPDSPDGEAPGFFNLRVLSLAAGAFGAFGMIAEWAMFPNHLLIAIVAGVIFAFLGRWVLRMVYNQQASGTMSSDFTGLTGEVSVDIPVGGIGEVRLVANNNVVTYEMAQSADGQAIPSGAQVIVITSGKTLTVEKK